MYWNLRRNSRKELSVKGYGSCLECRNPALFIEKYLQLDDDLLRQEFEIPIFSILEDVYPWV